MFGNQLGVQTPLAPQMYVSVTGSVNAPLKRKRHLPTETICFASGLKLIFLKFSLAVAQASPQQVQQFRCPLCPQGGPHLSVSQNENGRVDVKSKVGLRCPLDAA